MNLFNNIAHYDSVSDVVVVHQVCLFIRSASVLRNLQLSTEFSIISRERNVCFWAPP